MIDLTREFENSKLRTEIESLRQRVAELEEGAKFFHEIENLKAQLAACEKDAKRYQWLRTLDPRKYTDLWMYCLNHDVRFDEQVDEAMK
jgi:hypothetical protein